ncbi:MAG TPA: hypothetical protein PKA00_23000 [Saprospiraceae bacterium]|nr:hypothetical protein [Saprospiraceae bacterium]
MASQLKTVFNADRSLKIIAWLSLAGLVLGMLLSLPLWLNDRLFPLVPLFSKMPVLPNVMEWVVLLGCLLSLLIALVVQRQVLWILAASLLLILLVQDQMRWQPWVYIYALFLTPFAIWGKQISDANNQEKLRLCIQVVLIGIYFWSGISKFNPHFVQVTYTLMLENLVGAQPGDVLWDFKTLGYLIPIVETAIGIGLFFPKSRKWATIAALLTHTIIIVYVLSQKGIQNFIILPWNLVMMGTVFLSCYSADNAIRFRYWPKKTGKKQVRAKWVLPALALAVLTWGMPLLRFGNLWDNYLSFNLYSDNISYLYVGLRPEIVPEVEPTVAAYFTANEIMEEGETLDVFSWSLSELKVPVYPEERVFKQIAHHFCEQYPAEALMFIEFKLPFDAGKAKLSRCSQ